MKTKSPILLTVALMLLSLAAVAATIAPENLPRALEAQRKLVAERPYDAAAWNDLGNLLVLANDLDQAETAYQQAMELAPEAPALHFNLGLLHQQQGELRAATEDYRRVVELEPGNAWAHYQLGAMYEARGQSAKAIASYGRALKLDATLAFPDVNPHVIESELLTEAMLRGYHRGLPQTGAPRVYQEPGRITALLLRTPEEAGAEMEGEAPSEEMAAEETMPRAEPEAAAPDGPEEAAAGQAGDSADSRRVLTEQDLDDRPVNQATPQGRGGGYRPPARAGADRTPTTVRSWRPQTQPRQGAAAGTAPQVVPGSVLPAQPGSAATRGSAQERQTPPRTRRTPIGVNSTGRLDVYLAPAEERRS